MKRLITSTISILFLISFVSIFTFIHLSNVQAQEGIIYGKVLDKDKGKGIANVWIEVKKDGEEICNIWTDDEGNYKLPSLEQGDYTFSVYSSGYELFEDKTVSIKESEEKKVNFTLTPHYDYIISGKVYKSDGKTPVEGAELIAYNTEDNMPDGFATSSEDGSYTVKSLKPGTYNLLCISDGATFPIKKDITVSEEKTTGIDFIAYDNFISGVIKDEQGNSIKDAKVSIQYIPTKEDIKDYNIFFMKMMGQRPQEVKTDNSGRYKISSLTPGNYNIEIYSAELGRKMKEDIIINQDTKRTNLNFALGTTEKVSSIYGKVTEEDDITPVANAYVITADSNKKLAHLAFGSLKDSFYDAVNAAKKIYSITCDYQYDVLLLEILPPLDRSIYQAQKALENNQLLVKDNGAVIICSGCTEGIGSDYFYQLAENWDKKNNCPKDGKVTFGSHKIKRVNDIGKRINIFVKSTLDDDIVSTLFYTPIDNISNFIHELAAINKEIKIGVVYDAAHLVLKSK